MTQAKMEQQAALECLFGTPEVRAAIEAGETVDKAMIAAKAEADAMALRYVSEMECPADIKQFGKNHNIPTFAEVTWMAGFQQGWRMANAIRARAAIEGEGK